MKTTSIESNNTTELIMEAARKGYRKVEVVFFKIKLSDFPKSIQHLPSVERIVGTCKTAIFDVIEETSDIIGLLKNKDVEKINFI